METTTTTGTGQLTLAGAVTGYQSFAAVGDGNVCPYIIQEVDSNGIPNGAWEEGWGTYVASGTKLTRSMIVRSSNSNAVVSLASGTKRVRLHFPTWYGEIDNGVCEGRLTLDNTAPVTTSDVTGATSVYFMPYNGNRIALFDGTGWRKYQFTTLTLALGTLTSGLPYDVFIYDNAGTLTLELLAWTNGTTRATALVFQDGVYCKTGALTRRYLGTFYTTSTTQTEDSGLNRLLWNMYNRVPRQGYVQSTTGHTYGSATTRYWNNDSTMKVSAVLGLPDRITQCLSMDVSLGTNAISVVRSILDWSGSGSGAGYDEGFVIYGSGTFIRLSQNNVVVRSIPAGYHFVAITEEDANNVTDTFTEAGLTMQWMQ
jgi:hypothetical protein